MKRVSQIKRVTSVDVARHAGVAQSTVSMVINDSTGANVSPETRARVLSSIAELGYQPHEGARSLRMRASAIIGLALPEDANEHYHDIALGVETYARAHAYSVFRTITHWNSDEERAFLQLLTQMRVDGLIFSFGTQHTVFDEIALLCAQGHSIVGLGFEQDYLDAVTDAKGGEQQVIDHLIALGHRHIGYIYGVADQVQLGGRLQECLRLQAANGLPVNEHWIARCGPTREDAYRATQALLASCATDDRPTALVVVTDFLAIAVYAALAQANIVVPRDMSVISFDNSAIAQYLLPPLTSVDGQATERGTIAARLLIERITTRDRPIQHITKEARLVVRNSTSPPLP